MLPIKFSSAQTWIDSIPPETLLSWASWFWDDVLVGQEVLILTETWSSNFWKRTSVTAESDSMNQTEDAESLDMEYQVKASILVPIWGVLYSSQLLTALTLQSSAAQPGNNETTTVLSLHCCRKIYSPLLFWTNEASYWVETLRPQQCSPLVLTISGLFIRPVFRTTNGFLAKTNSSNKSINGV